MTLRMDAWELRYARRRNMYKKAGNTSIPRKVRDGFSKKQAVSLQMSDHEIYAWGQYLGIVFARLDHRSIRGDTRLLSMFLRLMR